MKIILKGILKHLKSKIDDESMIEHEYYVILEDFYKQPDSFKYQDLCNLFHLSLLINVKIYCNEEQGEMDSIFQNNYFHDYISAKMNEDESNYNHVLLGYIKYILGHSIPIKLWCLFVENLDLSKIKTKPFELLCDNYSINLNILLGNGRTPSTF